MNSATVNSLVSMVRLRTDQVNSTTFDDTTDLKPYTRDSLKQLYEIMVSRWKDWYVVPVNLTLRAGVDKYPLPSDFRALSQVYLLYCNGARRRPLSPFTIKEYGRYSNMVLWRGWPFLYGIKSNKDTGPQLWLTPPPPSDALNAAEILYIPQWSAPMDDDASIDAVLPDGWEEWVVCDVALKMRTKLRIEMDAFERQKKEVFSRIQAGAAIRDGDPPNMVDAYESFDPWFEGAPSGPL